MSNIELKPCPFCGGTAEFFTRGYKLRDSVRGYKLRDTVRGWEFGIQCIKCGITSPKVDYLLELQFNKKGGVSELVDERYIAAEAWNRRAE